MSISSCKTSPPSVDLVQFVSDIVSKLSGIQLGERQHSMVQSRLSKHLSELGIGESEYIDYYNVNQAKENQALTSLLTTHHSYFFREYSHFEFLEATALSALVQVVKKRGDSTLRIWSAACSRGQEAYSLAMCLHLYLSKHAPGVKFEILGSDVDEKSVAIATNGVYLRDEIKEIPMSYLDNHWARGQGEISNYVKAKKTLKEKCTFQKENLFELSAAVKSKYFDIIFCRNVFIYFDQNQIRQICDSLFKALNPEGYLFVGISESLRGLNLPAGSPGPSIYTHLPKKILLPSHPSPVARIEPPKSIRVVCVDDSPSILALLKKGLTPEYGFEIVGVALNGQEAKEKIQTLKPDVVTMDIHMPVQGGLEYLEENMGPGHPPVIMVSSVSRENSDLALKAVRLGASDYVEKPSLVDMAARSEEIRNKLKSAIRNKSSSQNSASAVSEIDESFQNKQVIKNADKKIRLILARPADLTKLKYVLKNLDESQPPTVILIDGETSTFAELTREFKLTELKDGSELLANGRAYLGNLAHCHAMLMSRQRSKQASIILMGEPTTTAAKIVLGWPNKQLLVEDIGQAAAMTGYPEIFKTASDVVPHTSFPYLSTEYLTGDGTNGGEK